MFPTKTTRAAPRLYLSRYAGAARSRLAPPVPSIPGRRSKPTIAVVTVEGTIVNGRGGRQFLPFGSSNAGADTIAAALREVAADDSVSAIVLRVDSPGGSVTASETIWREVKRARERGKPVVASMGAVAASGGYYVSMDADAIVANPGTITGSIGVMSGKLVVRDLKDRLGVGSDTVRTNANADVWSVDELFTPEQQADREAEADLFYADFVERVAAGPQPEYRSRGCRCARPDLDRCRRPRARPGRRARRISDRGAAGQGPGRPGRGCRRPRSSATPARRCWTWCGPGRRRNRPPRRCRMRWARCWAAR